MIARIARDGNGSPQRPLRADLELVVPVDFIATWNKLIPVRARGNIQVEPAIRLFRRLGRDVSFWLLACLSVAVVCEYSPVRAATTTNRLVWRGAENSVDAEIDGWPLLKVLERIAAQTRWQIQLESGISRNVSAKFRDLKPGEALRRLLGDLCFVMLPSTNGPARLYVFRTSVQTATNIVASPPDQQARGPRLIPDELLVRLKPGATTSPDEFAALYGGKVIGRIEDLRVYRLKFPDTAAANAARNALATEKDQGGVESNYATPKPDHLNARAPDQALAGLTLRPRADGNQVVVALIDTAVQTEGTVLADFLLPSVSVAGPSAVPGDMPSHGSSMAETILYALSRAPDAEAGTPVRILPVDVYGASDSTTTFDIASGIVAAVSKGASIVNLSLGGTGDSPLIHGLIKSAHDQGVIFVAAAGNEPVATPTFPAAYPEVIAVTAIGAGGEIASYANRGEFVDVAAPGTSLVFFDGQAYIVTGTSPATARVSALAATLMAGMGRNSPAVEALIREKLAVGAPSQVP